MVELTKIPHGYSFLFVYFTELEKAIQSMMNTRTQYAPVLTIWRSERKLVLSATEAIPGHEHTYTKDCWDTRYNIIEFIT